ncbi:hypothetical protein PTKIN_Ptkin03bG0032800 [Pterospermum kingtungense]
MVFSSHDVSFYLDPPNWHQHNHQGSGSENPQLPPLAPAASDVGAGAGSIRPGSMADRARLAKISLPEAALKCPRCESTNTKFCYFNNYSLSQPRHFCKTCRRYWTRGGALRNVPVGGGCPRNKKNKSSSSKSSASAEKRGGSSSTNAVVNPSETTGLLPQQTPHLPFMDSLQNFSEYGLGNIGLNFGGIQGRIIGATSGASGQADMGFEIGTNSGMSSTAMLLAEGTHHQQFLFFEPTNGLFQFQSHSIGASSSMCASSRVSQLAPVKMENTRGLNLSRPVLLGASENNQYWGGNSWTDLSGLSSSSTNHL